MTKNNNKIIESIKDSLNNSNHESLNDINKVLFQDVILNDSFKNEMDESTIEFNYQKIIF